MEPAAARQVSAKGLLIKLALVSVVLAGAGLLLAMGFDWRNAIDRALAWVRDAGPLAFFSAMAVLPAIGFPLSPFTLGAGPAFGPVLGLPAVIAATWAALLVNVMISYALARWLLRPWLKRLVVRLGYRLPEIGPANFWDVSILLRVTPGPPFFIQSFLLGLGQVPVRIYLICSLSVAWAYATALVIFGDAILHGHGRMVLFGVSLFVILAVGAQLVRRHYARHRAARS